MEYLTSYSWAILIVSLVFIALYALNVFGQGSPRAAPGTCQVYRPNGPLTTYFIALTGLCSGEQPQFTASFSGSNNYVNAGNFISKNIGNTRAFTLSAWIKMTVASGEYGIIDIPGYNGWTIYIDGTDAGKPSVVASGASGSRIKATSSVFDTSWHMVTGTYDGVNAKIYVDGALQNSGASTFGTENSLTTYFGSNLGSGDFFNGLMANLQVYNASLSANEIYTTYKEGIGGAPLVLQNLIGWWPLNGNANDYSGDNFSGAISGATFTSSWTNGYRAP